MLVAPHHQVKEVIQELLRNVICGTVLVPKQKHKTERIKFRKMLFNICLTLNKLISKYIVITKAYFCISENLKALTFTPIF